MFVTWDADHVTLHREEDYEAKGQGIYKVFLSGNGAGTPRIDSKRVVEGAGLSSGRYLVTHVDEDRITFSKTPLPVAEPVAPPTQAVGSSGTPLLSLTAVAERTGVTVMQLRHDMNAGLLHPVMLPPEQAGRQRIAGIEEAEVERFRRWRVKYRGASYPDIGPEDLDGI